MAWKERVAPEERNNGLPRKPSQNPAVHFLSVEDQAGLRIHGRALWHYVHAVVRAIEVYFAAIPQGPGMDLRDRGTSSQRSEPHRRRIPAPSDRS